MSSNREIKGIAISYLLAIVGTILANETFVLKDIIYVLKSTPPYRNTQEIYFLWFGFFPALFLFLNGYTMTLAFKSKKQSRRRLMGHYSRRGLVLFALGMLFVGFWPANILVIAGVCFFISPFFIRWDSLVLQILLFSIVLLSTVLGNIDVPIFPSYSGIKIIDANAMDIVGFLFFNGYYSVLPWLSFFIMGVIYGKSNVRVKGWLPPIALLGAGIMIAGILVQPFMNKLCGDIGELNVFSNNLIGVRFHSFSFILFESGLILMVVPAINYIAKKWNETNSGSQIINWIDKFSSSKYTLYFFVCLQTGILWSLVKGGNQARIYWFKPVYILIPASLAMLGLSFLLVLWWKKKVTDKAPVEWLLKNISGSRK
ncbi:MAG: hypothetical protein RLZZ71_1336 [Bacteroidota bacterium]|jgi:uncharacterized membrane protein YeiB